MSFKNISLETQINDILVNRFSNGDNNNNTYSSSNFLLNIYLSVLKHPFDSRYHRVKLNKILDDRCINILLKSGFIKSSNGKLLIFLFNSNNMKILKKVNNILQQKIQNINNTSICNCNQDDLCDIDNRYINMLYDDDDDDIKKNDGEYTDPDVLWESPNITIQKVSQFMKLLPIKHKEKLWNRGSDKNNKYIPKNKILNVLHSYLALCIKIADRSATAPPLIIVKHKLLPFANYSQTKIKNINGMTYNEYNTKFHEWILEALQ